jgi:hypothetical protein
MKHAPRSTNGDYEQRPDGSEVLIRPQVDYAGHPIAQTHWGQCPRCRVYTTLFSCQDLRCEATRTSDAHEGVCPR